ncbi:MAG: DUF3810 domain-containing protein [Clostridia bacterium]|nr:DUF3810 domain-containing protein [Clostridia bacterium]
MRRKSIPGQLLRLLHVLILLPVWLLIKAAKNAPEVVETFYSEKLYPVIRGAVSAVTRQFPFSVAEISLYLLAGLIAVLAVIRLIKLILLKKEAFIRFLSFIISLVLAASYLVFAFYAMWGFNYYRTPLSKRLDLPERRYTAEELYEVCTELAGKAAELREKVKVDTSGVFCGSFGEMKKNVADAYAKYGETHPSFKANVPEVKEVLASEYLSRCGISGIYIFLTEEPNVNTNEPFLYLPFSAAHETGHFMGYAREEEASFLAFLVLREASDPAAAYSGYMHALVNCGNALAAADAELYALLRSSYSVGMNADLSDYSEYYKKYADTKTWEKSNEMNDNYLKFNSQEKGVLSYNEDVALILRFYDSLGLFG